MNKPYQSSVMINALAAVFFTGPKSFVARNHHAFKKERNHKTRFEVFKPMIALVATAVFVLLMCSLFLLTPLFV